LGTTTYPGLRPGLTEPAFQAEDAEPTEAPDRGSPRHLSARRPAPSAV